MMMMNHQHDVWDGAVFYNHAVSIIFLSNFYLSIYNNIHIYIYIYLLISTVSLFYQIGMCLCYYCWRYVWTGLQTHINLVPVCLSISTLVSKKFIRKWHRIVMVCCYITVLVFVLLLCSLSLSVSLSLSLSLIAMYGINFSLISPSGSVPVFFWLWLYSEWIFELLCSEMKMVLKHTWCCFTD